MEFWGIGKVTCALFTYRVIAALNEMVDEFVMWPDATERAKLSRRMKRGVSRTCRYTINAQVICDDRLKTISFYSDWPGSCADISVYQLMQLSKNEFKSLYFSPGEYLQADSTYHADIRISSIGEDNIEFNTCLAHACVVNKHNIGVLKARRVSLRAIRVQIKKKEDIDRILRRMAACVVLHNILRDLGDEWEEEDTESSDDKGGD
ncbi:hypothetical protein PHPALM_27961 [Phytophthora palmivora]|uniref:DDE Tnp4 domain-containing protein n=1 Tax=Phytophthora palmivora TaxID=4796 RepID=A0A2P4XBD1_9STRA|nr:hypothetical protein PHPALM_27961 [Phytophthora palmivora]